MNQDIRECISDLGLGIQKAIELSDAGVVDWVEYEKLNDLLQFQITINLVGEKLQLLPVNFKGTSVANKLIGTLEKLVLLHADWGMVQEFFIDGIDNVTQEDCSAHLRYMLDVIQTL